jgi:hypothetical protein
LQAAAPKPVVVKKAAPTGSGRFAISEGNAWDVEGASWAVNGGIFGRIGDGELSRRELILAVVLYFFLHGSVTWAREAEVKHGRICMLAALGSIVQDVYHFPFFDKWYNGEKVWGLHDAAIKSGALWQVCYIADYVSFFEVLNAVWPRFSGSLASLRSLSSSSSVMAPSTAPAILVSTRLA